MAGTIKDLNHKFTNSDRSKLWIIYCICNCMLFVVTYISPTGTHLSSCMHALCVLVCNYLYTLKLNVENLRSSSTHTYTSYELRAIKY